MISNYCCTTKFMIQALSSHPDFQTTAPWIMQVLSPGTEDITIEVGQTIGAVTSQSVSAPSFTNQTVTYSAFL